MTTLFATVGLPGSGKSTHVRHLLARRLSDGDRVARVNRDALRDQLHPGVYSGSETEKAVTSAAHAQITALLASGYDVYVDDTNLRLRNLRALRDLAAAAGAEFAMLDFTDVPVDLCVERDAQRPTTADNGGRRDGAQVGAQVVEDMFARFLKGGRNPVRELGETRVVAAPVATPYVPPPGKPMAVMADLDGTVALLNGRSPYDETCVSADLPNEPVIEVVNWAEHHGYDIVFMSGRTDGCYEDTERWLRKHVIPESFGPITLFMRVAGDTRPDHVVKLELFNAYVRNQYQVQFVLDDRDQVVKLWRSIGLPTFQVQEGNF